MSTVYALDEVVLAVGGRVISGAGDGGFCEVTPDSEYWENVKCVDGDVVSCANLDRSRTATVTLRYDSPSNAILQGYANTRSTVSFILQAPNGDTVSTDECRVQKDPNMSFSQKAGERQWTLFLDKPSCEFAA